MPKLQLTTERFGKHIFKERRFEVFNSVYDKLFDEVVLTIKENSHDLAVSEMGRYSLKFENEAEKSDLILELQQLLYEELARKIKIEL